MFDHLCHKCRRPVGLAINDMHALSQLTHDMNGRLVVSSTRVTKLVGSSTFRRGLKCGGRALPYLFVPRACRIC